MPTTTNVLEGVTFNEFQFYPTDPAGIDANGDGMTSASDNYLELHNTTGTGVDISGWEIWRVSNNAGFAEKLATIDASTTIGANGHYTLVESNGSEVDLSNIPGDAQFMSEDFSINTQSTFALLDPVAGEFIYISGPFAGTSTTTMDTELVTTQGHTQVGVTEQYVTASGSGPTGASAERATDGDTVWQLDDATPNAANCFAEGTLIATPDGEKAIQELAVGDLVRNADGVDVPVKWVGHQTIVKAFAREWAQLVRIAAGILDNHSDLYVTGDHGMVLDGLIVNASALVNGASIDWVSLADTPDRLTVYHIETEAHDAILANGAASETYLDMPGRMAFDNYQEYLDLYGEDRVIAENPMMRISSARLLPAHLRARIAA